MNSYRKSWVNDLKTAINKDWVRFEEPMSLEISESKKSKVYISASIKFNRNNRFNGSNDRHGSLYYKILVNGESINEYHVSDPLYHKKSTGINLHASTDIFPGNTTVEVQYRVSKNGTAALISTPTQRELKVLSVPSD